MSETLYAPQQRFIELSNAFSALHTDVHTQHYVRNIDACVQSVSFGGLPFPATINNTGSENAWVCSPLTTYSRYAVDETRRLIPRPLAWPLCGFIRAVDRRLRDVGLDHAVSVNNWLLSTNLYPSAEDLDFSAMREALKSRWPHHAIWFRSLNYVQHADWLHALEHAGFELIPTRQVYLFHDIDRCAANHQNLRRDLKLLDTTPLHRVAGHTFTDLDFAESERLYGLLYLDKYSRLNPQYTAAFVKAWQHSGLLDLTGFRDDTGRLRAVIGLFAQGRLVSAPFVGYDTSAPASEGLYRLLMAHVLSATRERTGMLNLSAGAAHFKRLRGGEPAIEYSAVLSGHLPQALQRALRHLRFLTHHIGVPIMRRFQL
ncbi:GNAT family N-acetyltransferase (plasmid) [Paraburkholderia sp. PREW-6R]|uniref:GNAT family N-acetyltransferase n=1 Tax=Paraburkholderia sp. PREW-6R TaxID=3141544 RepID=UPI0031F5472D